MQDATHCARRLDGRPSISSRVDDTYNKNCTGQPVFIMSVSSDIFLRFLNFFFGRRDLRLIWFWSQLYHMTEGRIFHKLLIRLKVNKADGYSILYRSELHLMGLDCQALAAVSIKGPRVGDKEQPITIRFNNRLDNPLPAQHNRKIRRRRRVTSSSFFFRFSH